MTFPLQPVLQNEAVLLKPLLEDDFEVLYALASDPLLWEQHPNKDRYQRSVFKNFFSGAMESGGAFIIYEKENGNAIGCSRYYQLDSRASSIFIGYTFFGRAYWGKTFNFQVKSLMLNHAFQFVEEVYFHIGAQNYRSQKSIEKIGAKKIGEEEVAYYGEAVKLNFLYLIRKQDWQTESGSGLKAL